MPGVATPILFSSGRLHIHRLAGVVTGAADDIAPAEAISRRLPGWNARVELEVIPGADHFFGGRTRQLTDAISRLAGRPGTG